MANPLHLLSRSFDIRSDEYRKLFLSCFGAFLIIAFMILARSLREAFYLANFDVKTLPYITAGTAFLGLPVVSLFAKMLNRFSTANVLRFLMLILAAATLALYPFIETSAGIIIFYLLTAMGAMLLASGFWVFTSEIYPLRRAKKLFGLISAGGTMGAMVIGTSLSWLTKYFESQQLLFLMVAILVIFFVVQILMPKPKEEEPSDSVHKKVTTREAFGLAWTNKHLRLIAFIVMTATLASTLIDYQFKEMVRETLTSKSELASFFGSFYGWTGGIALVFQLLLVSRLMSFLGIARSLAFLPMLLFIGSIGILVFPMLLTVTLVRGGDNATRKSFYRSLIEVLYVPVSEGDRKKTKSFIDTLLDSVAEGVGAGIIFLWVTWGSLPSKYLSIFVIGMTICFFALSRLMGLEYFKTLIKRLKDSAQSPQDLMEATPLDGRRLLTVNLTRSDLQEELEKSGIEFGKQSFKNDVSVKQERIDDPLSILLTLNDEKLPQLFRQMDHWEQEHVPGLIQLLARDNYMSQAMAALNNIGDSAEVGLVKILDDSNGDFVIRRRIPPLLAQLGTNIADKALIKALKANRFEIRYRAAIALVKRRKMNLPISKNDWSAHVWEAIMSEIKHEKAVWELNKVLDENKGGSDEFISHKIELRGALSLEHTFRMLSLVLEEDAIKMAYRGIMTDQVKLKSIALEYLEYVLPKDIKERLWLFIGDISDYQKEQAKRPVEEVVSDLLKTGATLFASEKDKKTLKKALSDIQQEKVD